MNLETIKTLSVKTNSKIMLLVMDGCGGLGSPSTGKTELETAQKPNLDKLAKSGVLGLSHPIGRGITPGSGPAHLGLFGYDPLQYLIGRGVLEALGIGFHMTPKHISARANFATMKDGVILDRRAGRIPTEKNIEIVGKLTNAIKEIDGVNVIFKNGKEHRFVVILEGEGLEDGLSETDPQKEGLKPHLVSAINPKAQKAADVLNKLMVKINETLKDEPKANTCLLRGIAKCPHIPSMSEVFKIKPACIANYPMYKGLATLVGMDLLQTGDTIESEFDTLEANYDKYDFFYLHIKKTDSYGEDGNFANKVKIIEEVDKQIPRLEKLGFDVIVVTGDHSTPAVLKGHSWHPNPFVLVSKYLIPDEAAAFNERECKKGGLGQFLAVEAMPLMLGHAGKLEKYGA
ncbi:MAG: phosphoglycerate mutase [Candidatus Firestonebacteria bacterium RIFOXYA2_FULL_40_8]|nr:MAG: phosphoglycerate mutase [Candidatus Firestonebacteria bacterium RIFOXYA2_FULL_40_8]